MTNLSALSPVVNSSDVRSAVQSDNLQQPPKVHLRLVPPPTEYVWNLPVKPSDSLSVGSAAAYQVLGRIQFWFSPNKQGQRRVKIVDKAGNYWLAKKVKDLATECGLKYEVTRYAVRKLETSGYIQTKVKHFHGTPMLHFRPVPQEQREEVATRAKLQRQARHIRVTNRKTAAVIVQALETGKTVTISGTHLGDFTSRTQEISQNKSNRDVPKREKKEVTKYTMYTSRCALCTEHSEQTTSDRVYAVAKKKIFFSFVKKRKRKEDKQDTANTYQQQVKQRAEDEARKAKEVEMAGNIEEMLAQILSRITIIEDKLDKDENTIPSQPSSLVPPPPPLIPEVVQRVGAPGVPPPVERYVSREDVAAYKKQQSERNLAAWEEAEVKRAHALFDNRWKRQHDKWFNDPDNPIMSPDAVPGGFTAAVEDIMAQKKKGGH